MRQLKIIKQITPRNEGAIDCYLHEIGKYSLISAEEEVELSIRIRNGDEAALEKLVVANLRFVISVAKQYQNQGLSLSDLISEGNEGLIKAARKFDETRGFKFISYAVWWIRQAIVSAISEQTRVVRLPLNRISSINKMNKAILLLEQEFERMPADDEIADFLDFTKEEMKSATNTCRKAISLDKPVSYNNESDISLYDIVQTGDIPLPDSSLMQESISVDISRALKKMTIREATVITMSFGLFASRQYTLNDIAIKLNLTSERVRQIKSTGIQKLRRLLNGKEFLY